MNKGYKDFLSHISHVEVSQAGLVTNNGRQSSDPMTHWLITSLYHPPIRWPSILSENSAQSTARNSTLLDAFISSLKHSSLKAALAALFRSTIFHSAGKIRSRVGDIALVTHTMGDEQQLSNPMTHSSC